MKRMNGQTFKRLVKKRSYTSIFIIIAAIFLVWVATKSIGLVMLSLFLAGLFLIYQAFSGKKMRRQFIASALICFAGLGALWVSYPEDRVLWREEIADLEFSLDSLVDKVNESVGTTSRDPNVGSGSSEGSAPQDGQLYQVESVTDGDTIKVQIGSRIETIRFIGIDTPEVYGGVECFGREASGRMKQLVEGRKVRLEADPSQGDTDRYDRLLRFVFTEEGLHVGKAMLSEGYAREYTYNKPYKYVDEFIQAEADAKEKQLGLWSPVNC